MRLHRLLAVVVATLLLVSCASIPTEGPIRVEPQRTHAADQPIDVIPRAPEPGYGPGEIVGGFLHAMAESRGNYDVARAYLTPQARLGWQPNDQAIIYSAASERLTVSDDDVILEAEVQGRLDRRGSFTRVQDPYRIDFGLVQVDGQWRISNPPTGLLLLQDLFDHAFVPATLYWFDPSYSVLVPEVVYVPKAKRTASYLVGQLLTGPTEWLKPSVRSALPTGAQLGGEVEVTSDGVGTVPFTGLGAADAATQALMAAQLAATFASNPNPHTITHFRLRVDGALFPLPQSDTNGIVAVDSYARFRATNQQTSEKVFGVRGDRVVGIKDTTAGAEVEPLPGPIGEAGRRIDKLGVALDSSGLALVTEGSSKLSVATFSDGEPREVLAAPGLLAPQYTRFGEVWAVSATAGGSKVYRVVNGQAQPVEAPDLDGQEVRAFRLSPDGVRMAVVLARGADTQLAILQVHRAETVTLARMRPLLLSAAAQPHRLTAVGWRTDTSLTVLGSEDDKTEVNPYEVGTDALTIRRTSTQTWDATRLATSPYNGRFIAYALGQSGQVWRRGEDSLWRRWVADLKAVAVAG